MIKGAVTVHLLSTCILSGIALTLGAARHSLGIWAGSLIMGLNLLAIAWLVDRVLQKKSIAMPSALVVTKYALFWAILTILNSFGWKIGSGFVIGVGAVFPTLGYLGYKYIESEK